MTEMQFPGAPKIHAGRPALLLAPMEGVLDSPLRQVYSELGGFSFAVSEFIRVSQTPLPPRTILDWVPELREPGGVAPGGLPVQVQLLGSDPVLVAETALRAVRLGAWGIDLNFGCPAVTVNRNGGGAVLLRTPEKVGAIARETRAAIGPDVAFSAKIRLGWDHPAELLPVARALIEAGVDWIVVHARTREQGYQGAVDWSSVRELVNGSSVPVVANGDIRSEDELRQCRALTGVEHFMIGRGALADPSLAPRLARQLGLLSPEQFARCSLRDFDPESPLAWCPLLERFVAICTERGARQEYSLRRLKQWLGWAATMKPRARAWIDPIRRASSLDDAFALLRRSCPRETVRRS